MSLSAEPKPSADPAALPADPVAYRRRKDDQRVLSPFWIGLMVGAFLCVIAGIVVAKLLPHLVTRAVPVVTGETPPEPSTASAPAAESAPLPVATPVIPDEAPVQVAALNNRLDRIEAGQKRTTQAAGAALATASLVQAAQSSGPFSGELAAVGMLLPQSADVAALRRIAVTGAPTRQGLAASFSDAAARAAVAARTPEGDGWTARAARALASVVTIRRVDAIKGDGPDAVLARAEAEVNQGDLEGAVRDLARLPRRATASMNAWRTQAQARIDIDRHLAAIRTEAVRNLSQTLAANS